VKLSTLEPHWITLEGWASTDPFYIGVSFLCPHCNVGPCPTCGKDQGKRLAVKFYPPIDPAGLMGKVFDPLPEYGHKRLSGDTFDTLTLHPSIGFDNPPHFHGTIIDGEVTNQYPKKDSQ
jgi:hypothetical protein